jgi:hypothetical protein
MFAIVLALLGIQLTLAGLVFAATASPQPGAGLAIIGILVELLAISRVGSRRSTRR